MKKKVMIVGAGGHARVIADIVVQSGDSVFGFLDDRRKELFADMLICGTLEDILYYRDQCQFIVGIGDNSIRRKVADQYQGLVDWYTAIHPSSVIAPNASIGVGTAVMALATINTGTTIGEHCIINTGAVVEHDNEISSFVHLSPRAALGGTVQIGEETHIGIGAVVINNRSICAHCKIGAGATVVSDLVVPGTYMGVPAKRKGENP